MFDGNDGGPAFPLKHDPELVPLGAETIANPGNATFKWESRVHEGMSLRDWFAGQALAGMLAQGTQGTFSKARDGVNKAAQFAYEYADAMIAAREQSHV